MQQKRKVAILVGSLRKASFNRMLAKTMIQWAPESLDFEFVEIGQLPLYNPDLEDNDVPAWRQFREEMKAVDAVLFVTPEYNRSIPGALKNALDVGSRPMGASVWDGKPCAIVTSSPGAIGGFGANHHLRQALVFLNMPCMQQPEAYIGGVAKMFDDDGNFVNNDSSDFLEKIMKTFSSWINQNI